MKKQRNRAALKMYLMAPILALLLGIVANFATGSVILAARPGPSVGDPIGGGPTIPEPPPDDPNKAPVAPILNGLDFGGNDSPLTMDSIRLRWGDNSSYETSNQLQRRSPRGAWQTVASLGAKDGINLGQTYVDGDLAADTPYCYRVKAANIRGQSFSAEKCFTTLDGRSVWRAQIELRTANVKHANTDDNVFVSLGPGNGTWIDYGRDDFERGDDFRYDLVLGSVNDLSKVSRVYITKDGSDGWCLEGFTLLVNGRSIFDQEFGATASTCRWLDNDNGHVRTFSVSRETLRANALWSAYNQPPPPLLISSGELESRLESMLGDFAHGEDVYWGHLHGSKYVEVSRATDSSVHVDVDMSADAGPLPDPEVDIDFDLVFLVNCQDGKVKLDVTTDNVNVVADSNWFWETVSFGLIEFLDNHVEDKANSEFPTITQTLIEDQLPGSVSCISVNVDDAGNVSFGIIPRIQPPRTIFDGNIGTLPKLRFFK